MGSSVPLAPVTTATLPVRSVFSTFFSITSSCYSCIHWLEYNRKRRSLPERSYYKMGKFYAFCRTTSTISSGCSADGIAQNRKNDRFYLEDLLTLPKQNQYDKRMTNTSYFGSAARSGLHCSSAAACAYDPQSFEQCGHSDPETPHSVPTMFNPHDVNI